MNNKNFVEEKYIFYKRDDFKEDKKRDPDIFYGLIFIQMKLKIILNYLKKRKFGIYSLKKINGKNLQIFF